MRSTGSMKWAKWMLTAGAVVVGVLLAGVAWGKNVRHGHDARVNEPTIRVCVCESGRVENLERQLWRVENRLETYRRRQDAVLAEVDTTWTNRFQLLDSFIETHCNETLQQGINDLRKDRHSCRIGALTLCKPWFFRATVVVFGLIVIASLIGLFCRAWKNKGVEHNVLYGLEVVLWVSLLALICVGAFQLLSGIVSVGANGGGVQNITSPEANRAVLQAYEQLSNELERWGALLGILGTFFGLVLPVGGYLLQLKAVKQEEENVDKRMEEKLSRFDEKMQQIIDDKTSDVEGRVEIQVQQIWKEYANMQYIENLKNFQALRQQSKPSDPAGIRGWLWNQWLSGMLSAVQVCGRVHDDTFVKERLKSFIRELKEANQQQDASVWQNIFCEQNKNCCADAGVESLRRRCPNEMAEFEALLAEYGIAFAE